MKSGFCATAALLLAVASPNNAQTSASYVPPAASAALVAGVPFAAGKSVGERFRKRFVECDSHDTCDGKKQRYGCTQDRNENSALLELPGNVLFYDAKMGIDADGSPLSKNNPGSTDQADTSLRYPLPGKPSMDADKVPYVVVPGGGFGKQMGVQTGDVAAVVYQDKIVYALVADVGPPCKIGEGSIQLHEQLGHPVCRTRNANGECTELDNSGIEKNVLYFIFHGSKPRIISGLTPANVNARLMIEGPKLMDQFRPRGAPRNLRVVP
jgi:hypothetical protein